MTTQLRLVAAKIPVELYEQLDQFWHDNRLPSRSLALRLAIELLVQGRAPSQRRIKQAKEDPRP